MKKVAIIGGGGTVGSTAAFCLARRNILAEIVLFDARENMARSHAMDLEQAVGHAAETIIRAGDVDALAGAEIVIITAGVPERRVASRNEFLAGNRVIIREVSRLVREKCPDAVIITASNPIDVLNYELYRLTGFPPGKIIGLAENDSVRFRWAVARHAGVPVSAVSALAIGEHGESIFLFDTVRIHGKRPDFSRAVKQEIREMVQNWFRQYQELDSMRSSGWTSGENLAALTAELVRPAGRVFVCSAIMQGQYGISDVSLGVPVRLGPEGIREIIELPLSADELSQLQAAARRIREMLACGEH
ncbi:MAG: hypothetical protein GX167_08520 [Firmicutes bacterium]|nr:hypothetical protein [Bacillota bacterium]